MKDAIIQHVKALWDGITRVFRPRHTGLPFERIVFVAGINSTERRVTSFVNFWKGQFPDKEFVLIQEYYLHHQEDNVESMIDKTIHALADKRSTLVIGHSFGGIIALAAIGRMKSCPHVPLLVTLGSPHGIEKFGIRDAKVRHDIAESCHVPVLTFGGRIDAVVPDQFTHFDGEVGHVSIPCTHLAFLRINRTRKEVLAAVLQYFSHANGKG